MKNNLEDRDGIMKTETGTKGKKSVHVDSDFRVIDQRALDAKNRITISKTLIMQRASQKVRSFQVFENDEGDILLRPQVTVPAREAWIFQDPELLASLKRGIQQASEGKAEVVSDLDTFLDEL